MIDQKHGLWVRRNIRLHVPEGGLSASKILKLTNNKHFFVI